MRSKRVEGTKISRVRIQNARKHNLRIEEVDFPLRSLVAVGGPSGAGKTSLVLGTIYAAGAARYSSLGGNREQQLSLTDHLTAEHAAEVSGLPFVLSLGGWLRRRSWIPSVSSELGLTDDLGKIFSESPGECPRCSTNLIRPSVERLLHFCAAPPSDAKYLRLEIALPGETSAESLLALGFTRAIVAGTDTRLEEVPARTLSSEDRLVFDILPYPRGVDPAGMRNLLKHSNTIGAGRVVASILDGTKNVIATAEYSEGLVCGNCGFHGTTLTESDFNPRVRGSRCPVCIGTGVEHEFSASRLIASPMLPLLHGGILPWDDKRLRPGETQLENLFESMGLDAFATADDLAPENLQKLLFGESRDARVFLSSIGEMSSTLPLGAAGGVAGYLRQFYRETRSSSVRSRIERFLTERDCTACGGTRLRPEVLARRFGGKSFQEIFLLSLGELCEWLPAASPIAVRVTSKLEISRKLGIEYLPIVRAVITLSSGERERVRILRAIVSELQGVLYLLDEPLAGLFPSDRRKVAGVLRELVSAGNSICAIENDREFRSSADWICDLGPGGGKNGGKVLYNGPSKLAPLPNLARFEVPQTPGHFIEMRNVSKRNIQNQSFRFPVGALTVVAGPSGSGKSTLLHEVIVPEFRAKLLHSGTAIPKEECFTGVFETFRRTGAIGTRSNVASFVQIAGLFREFFGQLPETKVSGSLLAARFRGKNFHEVFALTVAEALAVFERIPKIARMLKNISALGLDYLVLGQPAATLSDGEVQRLNLLRNLPRAIFGESEERYLIVCDEPARGLAAQEIVGLARFFRSLSERGHTIVCGEHEPQFLLFADYFVELGPGGGPFGGKKIAEGKLGDIIQNPDSAVGRLLRQ